ncbi:hypothetical protein D3C85_1516780 [compost metagenome]
MLLFKLVGQPGQQGNHRGAVVGQLLQRHIHVLLAGFLVRQGAVGDQGDVDLLQSAQTAL